ncbi:Rad3-related DNA helicase [Lachnospiraceae bacterium XBB1006]|nr:Rad3-related DNA helicase [Lachnospiraceae bacterium XBB1006]
MRKEEKPFIRVSVRNFVEFLLRSGDIDDRRGNLRQTDAMLMGSRIHRKIQQSMGGGYQAEVTLKLYKEEPTYSFSLEGRADGIFEDEEGIFVDEIKGMYMDVHALEEPILLHEAQAKCYAYIYLVENDLQEIGVQMTYCNLDSEEIKRFRQRYSKETLCEWFEVLYQEYQKWVRYRVEARAMRQTSIWQLSFPFPYRNGQKELIQDVYRSILRKKTLFVQAPTGVGKTLCTIFPAVKAVGESLCEQIFYLTAKTITRTAAAEAFALLIEQGYRGKVLLLTAKDKVCPLEERSCNPVDCPYAKGYFDRINDAVFAFLKEEGLFDRERLVAFALEQMLCPFEFSLDVSLWCDAIICDYNYVFDPNVYLKRFFSDGVEGEYVFLVDEAHNLIDRGREMYSAVLYKESFLAMKRLMTPYSKRVVKALEACNRHLLTYKRECETYKILPTFSPFLFSLLRLSGELERFFKEYPGFDGGEEFGEFYFALRHFLNMCDIMDENYEVYTTHDEEGRFVIKLYCIDTAGVIGNRLLMARSTVFFSATLLPITYYKQMLTTEKEPYAIYAQTAFSPLQSGIFVATDVSSKFTRRNALEYQKMATYIRRIVEVKPGNYMVFFPSYGYLRKVLSLMDEETFSIVVQDGNMSEAQRETFLQQFEEEAEKTVVGFCVMGGIFSEGINLTGEKLIGAILVGTGLPGLSVEQEILKKHYEEAGKNGFDYAFRYPGMNKVLQAGGRVIRTKEDRGIIVLLDERFCRGDYQTLFPKEWANRTTCNLDTIAKKLIDFWQER